MPDQAHAKDVNVRNAAVLLSMMGADEAVDVTKRVDPLSAHRLIRSLGDLGADGGQPPGRAARIEALRGMVAKLRQGGTSAGSLAAKLRESVLNVRQQLPVISGAEAEVFFERLALLDKADASFIWRALSGETPQAIALIANNLSPGNVAKLLAAMPPEVRDEVAYRMIVQGPPTPDALNALAQVSERFLKIAASGGETKESQTGYFVQVVSHLDRALTRDVLEAIRSRSEVLAASIEQRLFSFLDLLKLPGIYLQVVLRNVTTDNLALAMKGTTESQREVVFANLSQRARAVLEEEISLMGAVPVAEVERAQREIVQAARALEASGEIQLESKSVEYIE